MQKYAFVDRDGTILQEPDAPKDADPRLVFPIKSMNEFHFIDGAIQGLETLTKKGYNLVLVTNQPYLGTAQHPRKMFDETMGKIYSELGAQKIQFSFVMICPHGPDEKCDCRKPKIGGLKELLEKNKGDIDFSNSLMFGDRDTDRQFAENLGVRFVRIERNKRFGVPDDA